MTDSNKRALLFALPAALFVLLFLPSLDYDFVWTDEGEITSRQLMLGELSVLSALWHPMQALADLLTLRENLGPLHGRRLAITWVHSPQPASAAVVHSLLHAALRAGMQIRMAASASRWVHR